MSRIVERQRRSIRLRDYNYSQAGAYSVTVCTQGKECRFGEVVDGEMTVSDVGQMIEDAWCGIPERFPMVDLDAFVVMPNHIHGIVVIVNAGSTAVRSCIVGTGLVPAREPDVPVDAPAVSGCGPTVPPAHQSDESDDRSIIVGAGLVPARPCDEPDNAKTSSGCGTTVVPARHTDVSVDAPAASGNRATTRRATTRVAPTLGDIVGAFKSLTTNACIRGVRDDGWPPFDRRLWQRNYYEHVIRDADELRRIRAYVAGNPARWADDRENPDRVVAPRGDVR